MITVYTLKGHCSNCEATKRILDRKGIEYVEKIMTDADRETFKAQGHLAAPVVITDSDAWAGHRIDKLSTL